MDCAMKRNSRDRPDQPVRRGDSETREIRTCKVCGVRFSAGEESECCPVCALRGALGGGVEASGSFSENAVSTSKEARQRFEHYELVTDEDGRPVELGRGAMGSPR
jgi:hypothetical protein